MIFPEEEGVTLGDLIGKGNTEKVKEHPIIVVADHIKQGIIELVSNHGFRVLSSFHR